MEKTKKPVTAGILDIVAGAFAIMWFLVLMIARGVISGDLGIPGMESVPAFVPAILSSIAIPTLIIGVFALTGGIFALQRKLWGLALAGSIAATIFWFFIGIPAIVLTAQSREEFE